MNHPIFFSLFTTSMKKLLFMALCGSLLLLWALPTQAQRRDVVWLQGLGAPSSSWNIYRNLYDQERCINGYAFPATTGQGLQTFQNGIEIGMSGSSVSNNSPRSIAIGHSTGGIIARRMVQDTVPAFDFGGIITVGSPNRGADIVNSLNNGAVQATVADACNRLAAGPTSNGLGTLTIIINGWTRQQLCNSLSTNILMPAIGFASGLTSPTAQELRVGSQAMQTVNSNLTTKPHISIWGDEQSPVHWRLAGSYATGNQDDQQVVDIANGFRNAYHAQFLVNQSITGFLAVFGFFHPQAWIMVPVYQLRALAWKQGRDWLDRSEDQWNGLINCHRWETRTITVPMTTCGPLPRDEWQDCVRQCRLGGGPNCITTPRTITQHFFMRYPSDGFFCEDRQIIPGLDPNGPDVYRARGVNHSEETNTTFGNTLNGNDEMGDIFNQIWDRTDFFGTNTPTQGC